MGLPYQVKSVLDYTMQGTDFQPFSSHVIHELLKSCSTPKEPPTPHQTVELWFSNLICFGMLFENRIARDCRHLRPEPGV